MNLIYDRTQSDVDNAIAIRSKYQALGDWSGIAEDEIAQLKRGTYSCFDDMNRVDAAVRELGGMLTAAGYPVEYVDPRKLTPSSVTEVALTSESFQQGAWLYTTGGHSDMENYICTNAMIPIVPDVAITARVDIDILSDSGFVWYDADKAYIGGTTGGAPILWGSCFQAIPPANAAYCNININASAVTTADIGTVYVRQVANPESAGLPEGYTQVEYIESHGTEYIDTGFKPDGNTRVICEFMPLDSTKAYGIFGSRTAYLKSAYNLFVGDTGTHFQDDYNNTSTTNVEAVANTLYVIDKNKNVSTINGTQNSVAYSSFEVEYSMYLFGVNTSGTVNSAQLGALRMYSCSIYDNGILVRYYIPCTSSTGAVGLYDTVSGAFFGNANPSSVEPVDLPDGYTQVEYIQSSSTRGQYIDTGYKPNNNTRVTCKISNFPNTRYDQAVFGSRTDYGTNDNFMFLVPAAGRYRTDYSTVTYQWPKSLNFTGIFDIDKNKNTTTINGGNSYTFSAKQFSSNHNIYIFAQNTNGKVQMSAMNLILYELCIYDNGVLVRQFIPCKDSNNNVGLYDIVAKQFYGNANGGTFSAGAEVSPSFSAGMPVPEPAPPPGEDVWQIGDIVKQSEWVQYIANVQALRDAYYTMTGSPELPEPTAPLTYDGANAIEKLLYDVSQLYDAMVASYRPCGAFKCGNNAQHLPLQRSVI